MTNEIKHVTLDIAGFQIRINLCPTEWSYSKKTFTEELLTYYAGFICRHRVRKIDFTIDVIEQRQFIFQKKDSLGFMELFRNKNNAHIITYYQISIMQFQLLINNTVHTLLEKHKGNVFHASANEFKGGAILFMGPSGQGKSTIMKLLSDTYPALGDDSVIVRKIINAYYVFQTPTMEKESWVRKSSNAFPLRKIFFLGEKNITFRVMQLADKKSILKTLTKQLITDKHLTKNTFAPLFDLLTKNGLFFSLHFLRDKTRLLDLFKKEFQ